MRKARPASFLCEHFMLARFILSMPSMGHDLDNPHRTWQKAFQRKRLRYQPREQLPVSRVRNAQARLKKF